jgi:hypothetical protein
VSDAPHENRGPDNCADCGAAFFRSELDEFGYCAACADKFARTCHDCKKHFEPSELTDESGCGELRCAECVENDNNARGERAEQQLFEDYHSGEAPDYVYEAMAAKNERG